jgi:hypothetical protein
MGVPAIVAMTQGRIMPTTASWKAAFTVLAGSSIVVAAAGLALFEQGALGRAFAVLARSDVSYVATYGSGGITGTEGAMLAAARILIPVLAGACVAAALVARKSPTAAALAWWLGWDIAASMVSGRGFPHYVQQAEPALCLALALVASALWQRYGHRRLVAAATVAAATISCQLVLWIPSAEVTLAHGGGLPGLKDDGVATSQLPAYYVDGYRRLVNPSTAPMFDGLFPADLALQRTAVSVVVTHSAPGDRIFVWGWVPWIYSLSNRMPAGRFVALDSAYYVEPSAQVTLLGDLEAHPPTVLVVEAHPAPGALLNFLQRHRYQRVVTGVGKDDFWVLQVRILQAR